MAVRRRQTAREPGRKVPAPSERRAIESFGDWGDGEDVLRPV